MVEFSSTCSMVTRPNSASGTVRICIAVSWVWLSVISAASVFESLERPSLLTHLSFDEYEPSSPFSVAGGVFAPEVNVSSNVLRDENGHSGAALFCRADASMDLPVGVGPLAMPTVTFGAWVKPTAAVPKGSYNPVLLGTSSITGATGRSIFLVDVDNTHHWAVSVGPRSSDVAIVEEAPLRVGEWHLVAAQYDSAASVVGLFVDGELFTLATTDVLAETNNLAICHGGVGSQHSSFYGDVDDFFIFSEWLSLSSLDFLYEGTAVEPAGPAAGSAGYALRFDTSYVTVPLSNNLAQGRFPGTTMLWLKPMDVTTGSLRCVLQFEAPQTRVLLRLLAESPHSGTETLQVDSVRFRVILSSGLSGATIFDWKPSHLVAAGSWTNLALVFDEFHDTFALFVNGSLQGSLNLSGSAAFQAVKLPTHVFGDLTIGAQTDEWGVRPRGAFFVGEVDEVALYSAALTDEYIGRTYQSSRSLADEFSGECLGYWRFNEGCGMSSVNGIAGQSSSQAQLDPGMFLEPNSEVWVIAGTPIDLEQSVGASSELLFFLNGSQCIADPQSFHFEIVSVPSVGSVHTVDETAVLRAGATLLPGDTLGQFEAAIYLPDPSLESSYTTQFSFRTISLDGTGSSIAIVTILVQAEQDVLPQFSMDDTVMTIEGYAVSDTDVAEGTNTIDMSVGIESDSLETTLKLGSSRGLNFADGSKAESVSGARTQLQFYGPPESVSSALDRIELSMAAAQGQTIISVTANDMGVPNDAVSDSVQLSVSLRSGGGPVLSSLEPSAGSPAGGYYVSVFGENFGQMDLTCVFGDSVSTPAVLVSNSKLQCLVPSISMFPNTSSLLELSLVVRSESAFESNSLRVQFYDEFSVDGVFPSLGPVSGGTEVVVSGSGFYPSMPIQCRFKGSAITVSALFVNFHRVVCVSPVVLVAADSTLFLTGNGVHFSDANTSAPFLFHEDFSVGWITPGFVPAFQPSNVTVIGHNFIDSGALSCVFGNQVVTARYVSKSIATCAVPVDSIAEGTIEVSMSSNSGVDRSPQTLTLTVFSDPTLYSLAPKAGFTTGATPLVFSGKDLPNVGELRCRFFIGTEQVFASATYVNEDTISCLTPSVSKPQQATVDLVVTATGQSYCLRSFSFAYIQRFGVDSVSPSTGPSSGGTHIVVKGNDFVSTGLFCGFTSDANSSMSIVTEATFVTSNIVKCISPAVPTESAATYTLRVGLNGVDWSPSSQTFRYDLPISEFSMSPNRGPASQYTTAIISADFTEQPEFLVATVGSAKVPCVRRSSSDAECVIPPSNCAGDVDVSISTNGQQFSLVSAVFSYYDGLSVASVSPGQTWLGIEERLVLESDNLWSPSAIYVCRMSSTMDVFEISAQFESASKLAFNFTGRYAGRYNILLSANSGVNFEVTGFSIEILEPPSTISIAPSIGSTTGGTSLHISGTNFDFRIFSHCVFVGNFLSDIVAVDQASANSVACSSPTSPQGGNVQVYLSTNGVDLTPSSSAPTFLFVSLPPILKIAPASGSISGGTSVAVEISSTQLLSDSPVCLFGSEEVQGWTQNETHVLCTSPSLVDSVSSDGSVSVPVSIRINEQDSFPSSEMFQVFPPPRIFAVTPKVIASNDTNTIVVSGANFVVGANAHCAFDRFVMEATVLSSSELTCRVPPQLYLQHEQTSFRAIEVDVTFNVVDFTATPLTLFFSSPVGVTAVLPSSGPLDGGTPITLVGHAFQALQVYSCRFSVLGESVEDSVEIDVGATFVTSGALQCKTPTVPSSSTIADIHILQNDVAISDQSAKFLFSPRPVVAEIQPASGATFGGTKVHVAGNGFLQSEFLHCVFDGLRVAITEFISDSEVVCIAPAHAAGPVTVEITNNNVDFSSSGNTYVYADPPVVSGISPKNGWVSGGTVVTVSGWNLGNVTLCRFGDTSVHASVQTSESVICVAPNVSVAGAVEVDVSSNGVDFTQERLQFVFQETIALESIAPSLGPENGATVVTITGLNFVDQDTMQCIFRSADNVLGVPSVAVAAQWLSTTQVTCATPTARPGSVDVVVSPNGQEETNSLDASFFFHPRVVLSSLEPTHGSVYGGTPIRVFGTGFLDQAGAQCCFDDTCVAAEYESASEISCVAPAAVEEGATSCTVTVSLNRLDRSNPGLAFQFDSSPLLLAVSPRNGPAAGGTLVQLSGSSFVDSDSLSVHFTRSGITLNVAAVFVSDTIVQCVTPEVLEPGLYAVSVFRDDQEVSQNSVQFVFQDTITIAQVVPSRGVEYGGTDVLVVGTGFADTFGVHCVFGQHQVNASWISSDVVRCTAPATEVPGIMNFTVTQNDGVSVANQMLFEFTGGIHVTSFSPSFGVTSGGTKLHVFGTGFVSSVSARCLFDGRFKSKVAEFISDSEVVCIAPAHAAGPVTVEITNNNVDFSSSGNTYVYADPPVVSGISPKNGWVSGGTVVTVSGWNLGNVTLCRFGDTSVHASVQTSESVICVAPNVSVAGAVEVDVSSNGVDFTQERLQFVFQETIALESIAPSLGPENGATVVTITGLNFVDQDTMQCIFRSADNVLGVPSVAVAAQWLSTTQVTCATPTARPGSVDVVVSPNGQEETNSLDASFFFHPRVVLSSLEPTHGSVYGGTPIRVFGTGFLDQAGAQCCFDDTCVAAEYESASEISCVAPAAVEEGATSCTVTVSLNQLDRSSTGMEYAYDSPPEITAIEPSDGPMSGGTELTVFGSRFVAGESLVIRFGMNNTLKVAAEVVSDSQLRCVSPSVLLEGLYSVEAGMGTPLRFFDTSVEFSFVQDATIRMIDPQRGPDVGGTLVRIYGANFVNTGSLTCKFGETLSAAVFVSSSVVECMTPPAAPGTQMGVTVANIGRTVRSVAAFGQTFDFYQTPTVSSVVPSAGSLSGGTPLHVLGTGLSNVPRLFCELYASNPSNNSANTVAIQRFPALLVNDSAVACVTPPFAPPDQEAFIASGNQTFVGVTDAHGSAAFVMQSRLDIVSAVPQYVPAHGGAWIFVFGFGFNTFGMTCHFSTNNDTVESTFDAIYVNASTVKCLSPQIDSSDNGMLLQLSKNGVDLSANQLQINTFDDFVVNGVAPATVPEQGGVSVRLSGASFAETNSIICKFTHVVDDRDYFGAGKYLGQGELECNVPQMRPGAANVVVSLNGGHDFQSEAVQVTISSQITIAAVSPSSGPITGGTLVTIAGTNFKNSTDAFVCAFGTEFYTVAATPINSTHLTVEAPMVIYAPGPVPVMCSDNGQNFTTASANVQFLFTEPAVVTAVDPNRGPSTGNTIVTVAGTGLVPANISEVWCVFVFEDLGQAIWTVASHADVAAVQCPTPSIIGVQDETQSTLMASVEVSTNGVQFTNSGVQFAFDVIPTIRELSPSMGSEIGGSVISLYGSDFPAAENLRCLFGSSSVPASRESRTMVQCIAPPHVPEVVEFKLTLHGALYGDKILAFVYHDAVTVSSVAPSRVSKLGGTFVTVAGTNFIPDADSAFCKFGNVLTSASAVSGSEIVCRAPPRNTDSESADALSVEITFNNIDFYGRDDDIGILYMDDLQIVDVSPLCASISDSVSITVSATNLLNTSAVCCRIGDHEPLLASVVNESAVTCPLPSGLSAGSRRVDLSNDCVNFVSSAWNVNFHDRISLQSVSPSVASAVGGLPVTVRGSNFLHVETLACKFTFLNAGTLVSTSTSVTYRAVDSVECVTPNVPSETISVEVSISNNGVHFSNSLSLTVQDALYVRSAVPSQVSSGSSTMLTVLGAGFVDTPALACLFDVAGRASMSVEAWYVNSSAVVCSLPPNLASSDVSATVLVTLNGVERSTGGANLTFITIPTVTSLQPQRVPTGSDTTLVEIAFSNATTDSIIFCRFGAQGKVHTSRVAQNSSVCVLQAVLLEAVAQLELFVGANEENVKETGFFITAYEPLALASVTPTIAEFGSDVSFHLDGNFSSASPKFWCRLGTFRAGALVEPDGTILCEFASDVLKQMPPSTYDIAVSGDGEYFSNSLPIEVVVPNSVISVVPSTCFQQGGALLEVYGSNFLNRTTIQCVIGDHASQGLYVSNDHIQCVCPAGAVGIGQLRVAYSDLLQTWDTTQATAQIQYMESPVVESVSPYSGIVTDTTTVTISGRNFPNPVQTLCVLADGSTADALTANATTVTCAIPVSNTGARQSCIALQFFDSSAVLTNCVPFQYISAAVSEKLTPSFGATAGGADIVIEGSGFENSASLVCKFGSALPVVATFVSTSAVRCVSPRHAIGLASVSVSNDGVSFVNGASLDFYYHDTLTVAAVTPTRGSVGGGTAVEMEIDNFEIHSSLQILCQFGSRQVVGVGLSARSFRCMTPAALQGASSVGIRVSLNGGAEFYDVGSYEYTGSPWVWAVTPHLGAWTGGTAVLVQGSNLNGAQVACRIDSTDTPATVSPNGDVFCVVPDLSSSINSSDMNQTSNAPFAVVVDGVPSNCLTFLLHRPVEVFSVFPDLVEEDALGAATFTLTGANFLDSPSLACNVGTSLDFEAIFVSDTVVQCQARKQQLARPGAAPSTYTVSVSNNGADFVGSASSLLVVPKLGLMKIEPSHGPSSGGTRLSISAAGFGAGDDVPARCVFLHDELELASVDVEAEGGIAGLFFCETPAVSAEVTVATVNVVTARSIVVTGSPDNVEFSYFNPPVVTAVSPELVSTSGGAVLTVSGHGFLSDVAPMCAFRSRWSDHLLVGRVVDFNSSLIECITPPFVAAGQWDLVLSLNGVDYHEMQISLKVAALPQLVSVTPLAIPSNADATVQVEATGLQHEFKSWCRFGGVVVPAATKNSQNIECVVPIGTLGPGFHTVELSNNGVDFVRASQLLQVYIAVTITSITPSIGPISGGTPLLISGSNFLVDAPTLVCRFASASGSSTMYTSGTVLSMELASCQTPVEMFDTSDMAVQVDVSFNDQDFTNSGLLYEFYSEPSIFSVSPEFVPDSGGSVVTICGEHFDSRRVSRLWCKMGNVSLISAVLQDTEPSVLGRCVTCTTPDFFMNGFSGQVPVGISPDGDLYWGDGIISVFPTPVIDAVSPNVIPEDAIVTLTISGQGFLSRGTLGCKFGGSGHELRANFVSGTNIECAAPANMKPGFHDVFVTFNGADWMHAGAVFVEVVKTVNSISPVNGPRSGGTAVTVSGLGLASSLLEDDESLFCVFDDVEIAVSHAFDEVGVVCYSPPIETVGAIVLTLRQRRSSSSEYTEIPNTTARNVFTLYTPEQVHALTPRSVSSEGGTTLEVTGSGFSAYATLSARLRVTTVDHKRSITIAVSVSFVSESMVTLLVPPNPFGTDMCFATVEISNNGVDFTDNGVLFQYIESPTLYRIEPTTCPIAGGVPLTVHGRHFVFSEPNLIKCRSGTNPDPQPAVFISSTTIQCTCPPSSIGPNSDYLYVSVNGVDYLSNDLEFLYRSPVAISGVSPSTGPRHGGTRVQVFGFNFESADDILCQFGDQLADALYVNSSLMECVSPPSDAEPAVVDFTILLRESSLLGAEVVPVVSTLARADKEILQFTYYEQPVVLEVQPKLAAAVGGSVVSLFGSSFADSAHLTCRFEGAGVAVEVNAQHWSTTQLQCISPVLEAGVYSVEVSNNGQDFSSNGVQFVVHDQIQISQLVPSSGGLSGGTVVDVVGQNFLDAGQSVLCRFGMTPATDAEIVSPTLIRCISPAAHQPEVVTLQISTNGLDFVRNDELGFEYKMNPIVYSLWPSVGPSGGGTTVEVHATNINGAVGASALCRFASSVVTGVVVSTNVVTCQTPPAPTSRSPLEGSSVGVEISSFNDGPNSEPHFSDDGVQFVYFVAPVVNSIRPLRASVVGGSLISVSGFEFFNFGAGALLCVFHRGHGEETYFSNATYVNARTVVCDAPEVDMPGVYSFDVSNNFGHDTSSNQLQFEFIENAVVSHVSPQHGSIFGGTNLLIQGSGFLNTSELACSFGVHPASGTIVPARFLTESTIECISPPGLSMYEIQIVHASGKANIAEVQTVSTRARHPAGDEVQSISTAVLNADGQAEIQRVHLNNPTQIIGGNFTLHYLGYTTRPLRFDATSEEVASALKALSSIADVEVARRGDRYSMSQNAEVGWYWEVTFSSNVGDLDLLSGDATNIEATPFSGVSVDVEEVRAGSGEIVSGTFQVCTPTGACTPSLASNVSADVMEAALSALDLGPVDVSRTDEEYFNNAYVWYVTFVAQIGNIDPLVTKHNGLAGSNLEVNVQEFVPGGSIDGTFTLAFGNETTTLIAFDALASEMKAALSSLDLIDEVIVDRSERNIYGGYSWNITFVSLQGDLKLLQPNSDFLTGSEPVVFVEEVVKGVDTLHGFFTLTFEGDTTEPIPVTATAKDVQGALTELRTVGSVNVSHTRLPNAAAWEITFTGKGSPINAGDLPIMIPDTFFLYGTESEVLVEEVQPGCCSVEVTINGQDFSSSGKGFLFDDTAVVLSVTPNLGALRGGTSVEIQGAGFAFTNTSFCVFGEFESRATVHETSDGLAVHCITPAQQSDGLQPVFVKQFSYDDDSAMISSSNVFFNYHGDISITQLEPSFGTTKGGTVVNVFGSSFVDSANLTCTFENVTVKGVFVNHSFIQCQAPNIAVIRGGYFDSYETPLLVSFNVSNNNIDNSATGAEFYYEAPSGVSALFPSRGDKQGGTIVRINGSNFRDTEQLACSFGDNSGLVKATYLGPEAIDCVSPPHSNEFGSVFITVQSATTIHEVQQVAVVSGSVVGGSFALSFTQGNEFFETDPIPFDANKSVLSHAISSNLTVLGDVDVSDPACNAFSACRWNVTFTSRNDDVPFIGVDSSGLTGVDVTMSVVEIVRGGRSGVSEDSVTIEAETQIISLELGSYEEKRIDLSYAAPDIEQQKLTVSTLFGAVRVAVGGLSTEPIHPGDANATGLMLAALKNLYSKGKTDFLIASVASVAAAAGEASFLLTFAEGIGNVPTATAVYYDDSLRNGSGSAIEYAVTFTNGTFLVAGSFTVSMGSTTTDPIDFDASASKVEELCEVAFPDYVPISVSKVEGLGSATWFVAFSIAAGDVPDLTVDASKIAGSDVVMTSQTLADGSADLDGFYTIFFGSESVDIACDATASAVKEAVGSLAPISHVDAAEAWLVSQVAVWKVHFQTEMGNVDMMIAASNGTWSAGDVYVYEDTNGTYAKLGGLWGITVTDEVGDSSSTAVAFDADEADIRAAFAVLLPSETCTVQRFLTPNAGYEGFAWLVGFSSWYSYDIALDAHGLVGSAPSATVVTKTFAEGPGVIVRVTNNGIDFSDTGQLLIVTR